MKLRRIHVASGDQKRQGSKKQRAHYTKHGGWVVGSLTHPTGAWLGNEKRKYRESAKGTRDCFNTRVRPVPESCP